MAYCSSLSDACRYLELTPGASDIPTATNATAIWTADYHYLRGKLLAAGITISSSGDDKTAVADIEAMLTSADVGAVFEERAEGKAAQKSMDLRMRALARLQEYIDSPAILEALGSTISSEAIRPRSMAIDYPNDDLDTSDYQSPLSTWGVDGDL